MKVILVALAVALTGCGSQRIERSAAPVVSAPAIGDEVRSDVRSSSNATQQSITGMGVALGKLSESVQGFGGDLAHITASAEAQVKATATLRSELSALAQGQAGLKNEMEQLAVNARAGRDAVVSTTQFSKEMRDTLISSYDTNKYTVWAMCTLLLAVVTALQTTSRRRAEARAKEHLAELKAYLGGRRP